MLSDALVTAYLERIGAQRPARPDLDGLRELQSRHVLAVPFENIDYHTEGVEVSLDLDAIIDKIVNRRRGGGCYELNPAFAELLRALGYEVEMLPGQVFLGGAFRAPMCHLGLKVTVDGEAYLVDIGFGKGARYPLRIAETSVVSDPHGDYQVKVEPNGDIVSTLNGNIQYRLTDRPTVLEDYLPTFWWYKTAPDSVFLHNLITTQQKDFGRMTLNGTELTRTDASGRHTEELVGEDAIREAYSKHFGIELDVLPTPPSIDPAVRIVMQID